MFVPVELKTLDGYNGVVNGLIQVVETGGIVFIVNEEGKLQGMPINNRAPSYLYAAALEWRGWDVLAGPVLIMGNGDGEFISVPQRSSRLLAFRDPRPADSISAGHFSWPLDVLSFHI